MLYFTLHLIVRTFFNKLGKHYLLRNKPQNSVVIIILEFILHIVKSKNKKKCFRGLVNNYGHGIEIHYKILTSGLNIDITFCFNTLIFNILNEVIHYLSPFTFFAFIPDNE